jgi:hypothetical protein
VYLAHSVPQPLSRCACIQHSLSSSECLGYHYDQRLLRCKVIQCAPHINWVNIAQEAQVVVLIVVLVLRLPFCLECLYNSSSQCNACKLASLLTTRVQPVVLAYAVAMLLLIVVHGSTQPLRSCIMHQNTATCRELVITL